MKLALVDDQPELLDKLENILKEYEAIHQISISMSRFSSAEELLETFQPLQYTVVFLDIFMTGMTGIQCAEKIRETDRDTRIIFLTTSSDFMPDAFTFHAYDYILKPVDPDRIFRVMDDILRQTTDISVQRLAFSSNRKKYLLPYSDIVFVRTEAANYLEIVDREGNSYRTRTTFSSIRDQLSQDGRFLRIIRGILVNMDYITGFADNTCQLTIGTQLPINVRNSQSIEQTWRNYIFSNIRSESRDQHRRRK